MNEDPIYLQNLQAQGNARGLAQLRTLALEFRSTLAKFPRAKSDLEAMLHEQVGVDYSMLAEHIERQLTDLTALDVFLSIATAKTKEVSLSRDVVEASYLNTGLQNAHSFLTELRSFTIKEKKEFEEKHLGPAPSPSQLRADFTIAKNALGDLLDQLESAYRSPCNGDIQAMLKSMFAELKELRAARITSAEDCRELHGVLQQWLDHIRLLKPFSDGVCNPRFDQMNPNPYRWAFDSVQKLHDSCAIFCIA